MNKKFIICALCLFLFSTAAFAEDDSNFARDLFVPQQKTDFAKTAVPQEKTVKKHLFQKNNEVQNPSSKQPELRSRGELRKHFQDRHSQEKESLYSALNLSEEQRVKAERLDATTMSATGYFLRKVQIEAKKLKDLKKKHASFLKIYMQERRLAHAKKNANDFFVYSKKSFQEILTKEQRQKFETLNSQKRKDMSQLKKNPQTRNLYQANP